MWGLGVGRCEGSAGLFGQVAVGMARMVSCGLVGPKGVGGPNLPEGDLGDNRPALGTGSGSAIANFQVAHHPTGIMER